MSTTTAAAITGTADVADAASPLLGSSSDSKNESGRRKNHWLVASYGTIALVWGISQVVLIPYVLHLLLLVTAILYAACHGSLILLDKSSSSNSSDTSSNATEPTVERETLKASDAYQFPLVGSVSLFSLYLAFKFLGKEWVNFLIGAYFGIIGCGAVAMTLAPLLVALVPSCIAPLAADIKWEHVVHHPFGTTTTTTTTTSSSSISSISNTIVHWLGLIPETNPIEFDLIFNAMDVVACCISAALVGLYYYWEKPWYMNNILGISFCLQGIQRFSLGTYKIGAILLVGLFFYDIFWVFGTDVMVTVAKNLDGPIKILLPRTLLVDDVTGKLKDLSLLGLGDIVIPGFFLALLLRFDAHRARATNNNSSTGKQQQQPSSIDIHESFAKPYFHTALAAYVAGLGLTLFIMMRFNAAQPALLYLVPACLGSSFITALVRGEVNDLLEYSEEVEEDENEEDATTETTGTETKKEK